MSSSAKQRAFFLIDSLEVAHGTEMLAMILAGELVKQGWEITFFAVEYAPATSSWSKMLDRNSLGVNHPRFRWLRRYLLPHRMIISRLWRAAKLPPPNLVWSPTNDTLTCMALRTRPADSPPFFVHDPSEAGPTCPHYESTWFQVCNNVTALSVHGERQKASAIDYYKMSRPVEVIRPASLPPLSVTPLELKKRRIRFGQFGRLASMKGSLFAVAALADCVARGGDAELHFHGDGPLRAQTEELTASLGMNDRVFFHGSYLPEHLDSIVENIDVSIMPSTYEGFGLVMLELLSRRRPVIASDVGSSREILGESGPGWVIPKANTTALAEAMLACCRDFESVIEKSKLAPAVWQSQFTPEQMCARYLSFWERHGGLQSPHRQQTING